MLSIILAVLLLLCYHQMSLSISPVETYRSLLLTHPLKTNIITAALLTTSSDAITQAIERYASSSSSSSSSSLSKTAPLSTSTLSLSTSSSSVIKHDYYRSFTMFVYGAFVFGLFVTYWFRFLSSLVPVTDLASVVRKVLVNQFFMSPFLNALFFTYVILTRNTTSVVAATTTKKNYSPFKKQTTTTPTPTATTTITTKLQLLKKKLSQDLIPTIYRSCVYWITLNLINFRFVKSNEQVFVTNLGFLIWTVYLSYVGFKKVSVDTK